MLAEGAKFVLQRSSVRRMIISELIIRSLSLLPNVSAGESSAKAMPPSSMENTEKNRKDFAAFRGKHIAVIRNPINILQNGTDRNLKKEAVSA